MIDSMDGPSCQYPPTDNEHYLVKDYKDVEKKIILEINLRWINILIKNSKVVWSIHMNMMIDILGKINLVMRDFIKKTTASTKNQLIDGKGLTIMHLNIRSLFCNNKFEMFKNQMLNSGFQIICLSETWLKRSMQSSYINIDGYNVSRLD